MESKCVYDLIGIGIGPFNLGLAALSSRIPNLNCLFVEKNSSFNWHPGLLLRWARLQVPFYADLVTLADPCSPFSYLSFLKNKARLFRFAIRENYFIKRTEYNEYCQWVACQLNNLKFNTQCNKIELSHDEGCYKVETNHGYYFAKKIVIGVGTQPAFPSFSKSIQHPLLFHSGDYLFKKKKLLRQKRITIIGSGQSAAEIFYDLLQCYNGEVYWFTRSRSLSPMDYSKFALEMTSPDYIDYFYSLDPSVKKEVISKQGYLYKGINASLIGDIYEQLDDCNGEKFHLHPNCECTDIVDGFRVSFYHHELKKSFAHQADAVILATGYRYRVPRFISPLSDSIEWDSDQNYKVNRNYSVDNYNSIFVQNAELHTHGFNAADLGMGPYRNAIILNAILGYDHYSIESKVSFQKFGLPDQPTDSEK